MGVEGVARISEPPAGIAETHVLDAVLDLEPPRIRGVAGKLALDAALVRGRTLHHVELRMSGEHLVMHPADPVPARADFAVGHREQILCERRTEGLKDLLWRVERDAAHQQ